MKTKSGLFSCSRGFTLAELVTVIAIIAILIGLLVPTITLIREIAQKVRQKSQFHGIEIALESFRTDFGDYPDSSYSPPNFSLNPIVVTGYCGAQKLAEAIIGWDGFGVHPRTAFMSDGMNDVDNDGIRELIYDVTNGINGSNGYVESAADNHKVRKGPYLELESANAVKLGDLYPGAVGSLELDTYVLSDMFGKVTHRRTNKRTGMPIMYYKADVSGTTHTPIPPGDRNVYKVHLRLATKEPIFTTMPPFGNRSHPIDSGGGVGVQAFYDRTANPNFPGPPRRPYRSESFILHSAGRDGLYGTADDVYNFDTE